MKNQLDVYRKTGPLFEDPFDESFSSDDDSQDQEIDFDIGELYKQIGAPNPILEQGQKYKAEVRTAFKLKFRSLSFHRKLPSSMFNYQTFQKDNETGAIKNNDETEYNSHREQAKEIKNNLNEKPPERFNAFGKTLFNLYPDCDSRLVYKKYLNQGDWQLENQGFANYLVDISKIVKTVETQYKYEQEDRTLILSSPENIDDDTLRFDSTFESGNLYSAYKISNTEYDLVLQNDINTKGHTQWFFFSVENTKKNQTVKFNIINLLKPDSLFNEGMQPVVFSTECFNCDKKGWYRDGFNISYFKNNIAREGGPASKPYYTLTFTYTFSYTKDTVYFAHCFPYTYSRLNDYLDYLCQDSIRKQYVIRKTLCQTLSKNSCDYLTISSGKPILDQEKDDRVGIVLTARQHPGESLASYMMQGVLEFLTSEEEEAQILRQRCVFKIVPMLNPDGVIHGNYRASLCGKDLNRKWKTPHKILQPTIYYTKQLVHDFNKTRNVQLFCDFHGHSRKKNTFFYGNSVETNPLPARIFPFLLSKMSKYISFEDSRFRVEKSKEETARVTLWRELKSDNIFTMEASFYGYDFEGKTIHFTEQDYINIGYDFCKGLCAFLTQNPSIPKAIPNNPAQSSNNTQPTKQKGSNTIKMKQRRLSQSKENENIKSSDLIAELLQNKHLIEMGNKSDDSGSDSDPSGDDLSSNELKKVLPVKIKNSKKKKKPKQEKITPIPDTSKKIEKVVPEIKVENPIAIPPKDDKTSPNSAKNTTFRIKNPKKPSQTRDSSNLQAAPKEIVMIDKATQTEELLFAIREEIKITKIKEYQPLSQQKDSKGLKAFNKNMGFLKNFDNSGATGPGYLTVLAEKSLAIKPSTVSISAANNLWIKGAKVEADLKIQAEQFYYMGKYQANRGTSTEGEAKPAKTTDIFKSFQLWNRASSFSQAEEKNKDKSLSLNKYGLLEEKKVSVQSFIQDDESYSIQNVSRQITSESPHLHNVDKVFSYVIGTGVSPSSVTITEGSPFLKKKNKVDRLPSKIFETKNKKRPISETAKERILSGEGELNDQSINYNGKTSPISRLIMHNRVEKTSLNFPMPSYKTSYINYKGEPIIKRNGDNLMYQSTIRPVSKDLLAANRPGTASKDSSFIKTAVKIAKEIKDNYRKGAGVESSVHKQSGQKKIEIPTTVAPNINKTMQGYALKKL